MAAPVIHLDFETRSAVDLKKAGVYRYAEDPSTEILCGASRVGDGPVRYWADLVTGLPTIRAHNAAFERAIWNAHPEQTGGGLTPERQDCTMARANALNLPASLEGVGAALGAPIQKDKAGHALMLKMCKASYTPKPGEMERLEAYCAQDVLSECAIDKMLPPLSPREREIWVLDQHINDRGFHVDTLLIERALAAVQEAQRRADRRMWELTGGAVEKASQAARIVDWLNARGIPCDSIAAGEHDDLILKTDLFGDDVAAQVIELRQASSKTFKFQSMLDTACRDDRIRGTLVYQGALSGRWTGRIPQPHNMKRIETEEDEQTVADALMILRQPMSASGHVSALEVLCGSALDTLSMCARPMITAPKGKKLVGGDFSNIEGRVCAALNDEHWKVKAFRDYDAGAGPDLYRVTAARNLGKPVDAITKEERQNNGKFSELSCQFQGGYAAYLRKANDYGVHVDEQVAKAIVAGWREANSQIVFGWGDLQQAAIEAVSHKGMIVPALNGRIRYVFPGDGFLYCRLPSGRAIAYPGAIVERKQKTVIIDGDEVHFDNWGVSFWGVKGGWRKLDLYGGMQMAHVVSGLARDRLCDSMFRIEAAGYPIVLTVHDESLSEVDEDFGSAADYQRIMEIPSAWQEDMPITAKAWEGKIYAH